MIEFNVRLGDPEAQVVLPLIDEPLLPLLVAGAAGRAAADVGPHSVRTASPASSSRRAAIPNRPSRAGRSPASTPPKRIPGVAVYHAGTAQRDGQLVTAGGRVLTVVGRGDDFAEADRARLRRRARRSRSTACSIATTSGERRSEV